MHLLFSGEKLVSEPSRTELGISSAPKTPYTFLCHSSFHVSEIVYVSP